MEGPLLDIYLSRDHTLVVCVIQHRKLLDIVSSHCLKPAAFGAGMAAVIMGGIIAAQPLTGKGLSEHTYMFAGEGRGATAMAEMIAIAIARETGETIVEARSRIWLVDTHVSREKHSSVDMTPSLWARNVAM